MIGHRFQDLQSCSMYTVIGRHTSILGDRFDMQDGWLVFSTSPDTNCRTVAQLISDRASVKHPDDVSLMLDLKFRIKGFEDPRWGGRRVWVRWAIYRCETSGSVFACPEDELPISGV